MSALAELPDVLTVEEAARLLRIGRSHAYAAVKSGAIPSIRLGRSLRVPRHQLERMLLGVNDAEPGGQPGSTQNDGAQTPHDRL